LPNQAAKGREPRANNLDERSSVMHPDMEAYLWITVKAFGFALVGIYATRIALHAYEIVKWGV